MKTVLIGFGRIANTISHDQKIIRRFEYASHAQVLAVHPSYEWIGVVDPSMDARRDAMAYNIPHIEDSIDKLGFSPEFAVMAIPPEYRLEALDKMPDLKAVLVEKPLGKMGQVFLDRCEQRGIRAYINFWRRGVPQLQELADHRLKLLIGQPQAVFATYGNGLFNNGSHLIDFIRMLFGEVRGVTTISKERLDVVGCSGPIGDLHACFALDMGDFPIMVTPIDFNKYREVSLDIWGTTGRYSLFRETLVEMYYRLRDHAAMSNQFELNMDHPSVKSIDVRQSFYNIYSMIADDTLPRASMATQEVLEEIADS